MKVADELIPDETRKIKNLTANNCDKGTDKKFSLQQMRKTIIDSCQVMFK